MGAEGQTVLLSRQHYNELVAAQASSFTIPAGPPTEYWLEGFDAPPKPRAKILDSTFEYVHSSRTDITKTWRKFGWVPQGEQHE